MSARFTTLISRSGTAVRLLLAVGVLALLGVVVSCGGYGGSNYMPPAKPPPAATQHIVTMGAITGFGSVHVNGLQFDTTQTTITVDGVTATQANLRPGQFITVHGHHDPGSGKDVADDIDFRGDVEGPVSAVDATAMTLTVLGQTVSVSGDTSFDDDISPAALAGIAVGDIVEVSGMRTADGTIHATRIEKKPVGARLQVIGVAAATDAAAMTLKINALTVNFSGAKLVGFPASGPQDRDLVEASGTTLNADGSLAATRLELRGANAMNADQDDEAQLEGMITRFASASDFDVNGRRVSTSAATEFDDGTAADLALNVAVEVEGTIDSSGVLAASKVRILHPAQTVEARLVGQVDALDPAAGTVTVLGTRVGSDAMTRFEDHGSQQMQAFGLANVQVGDWLEIRGRQASGAATLTATRIDRLQPQSRVSIMGVVLSVHAPNFTILSTPIATSDTTQFDGGVDAPTFFATAVGHSAEVRGSWSGGVLNADQVQLGESGDDGGDDGGGDGGGDD